jgi:hypothetical protein
MSAIRCVSDHECVEARWPQRLGNRQFHEIGHSPHLAGSGAKRNASAPSRLLNMDRLQQRRHWHLRNCHGFDGNCHETVKVRLPPASLQCCWNILYVLFNRPARHARTE